MFGLGIVEYSLAQVEQEVYESINSMDFAAFFEIEKNGNQRPKKYEVIMTVEDQINIIKQLEKEGFVKILKIQKDTIELEVIPFLPSPIKAKTLEHIARSIADSFSGSQLLDILLDYGIPRADIPYPNTKWRTLQEMFTFLATSPNPAHREKLSGAISVFLHPLNFNADEAKSQNMVDDFNKYLKYDGYEITVADDGDGYELITTKDRKKVTLPEKSVTEEEERKQRIARATPPPSHRMPMVSDTFSMDFSEELRFPTDAQVEENYSKQVEYETSLLRQPKVTEHLAVMRESYKALMAIVSSFCVDPTTPSRDLNTAYTELSKLIKDGLSDFCGDTSEFEVFSFDEYREDSFGIPFTGLYSAELEFKKKKREIHWNEIRPAMNAVLGQIEELCQTADSPEIISEPKTQKIIGDAMLLLSKIAASRKSMDVPKADKTVKMEITKMPEMVVRNAEDNVLTKGKKHIHLPKFSATDWSKITMRFVDDRNVLITADKKEQVLADYESLGFADEKSNKPNSAWLFLLGLAQNNGETMELPKPIPDKIRQHKLKLTARLKAIFKNESDPFHDVTETQTYKIKMNLIPPYVEKEVSDKFGAKDYLKEMMTEKSEG